VLSHTFTLCLDAHRLPRASQLPAAPVSSAVPLPSRTHKRLLGSSAVSQAGGKTVPLPLGVRPSLRISTLFAPPCASCHPKACTSIAVCVWIAGTDDGATERRRGGDLSPRAPRHKAASTASQQCPALLSLPPALPLSCPSGEALVALPLPPTHLHSRPRAQPHCPIFTHDFPAVPHASFSTHLLRELWRTERLGAETVSRGTRSDTNDSRRVQRLGLRHDGARRRGMRGDRFRCELESRIRNREVVQEGRRRVRRRLQQQGGDGEETMESQVLVMVCRNEREALRQGGREGDSEAVRGGRASRDDERVAGHQ
jgi:hypothetical protein